MAEITAEHNQSTIKSNELSKPFKPEDSSMLSLQKGDSSSLSLPTLDCFKFCLKPGESSMLSI